MKLLYVVHGFPPQATGGVELRAYYLARELCSDHCSDHSVTVFSRHADPALPEYGITRRDVDTIPVWLINNNFKDLRNFEGVYINRRVEEEFERALDEIGPDLVHIHHLTCLSTTISEVIHRRGIPQIMSLHDFWMGCPRGQRIRSDLNNCPTIDRELCLPCTQEIWGDLVLPDEPVGFLARLTRRYDPLSRLKEYDEHIHRVLSLPDLLLTPSEFSRSRFVDQGISEERIHALPYGLNTALFEGMTRKPSSTFRFGFIGSILPSKGADVLLKAFRRLERDGVVLDIYGEVVPYHGDTSYVETLTREIESTPGVRLHGRFENADLPRILEGVDALVVPSIWFETFCITIREGFLAGIPVIASDLGAMGEGVEHGVSGLLFRPGDAEDLKENMRRLVDEPGLRETLSGQGHRVKTIQDNAGELVQIYRETVDRVRRDHSPR